MDWLFALLRVGPFAYASPYAYKALAGRSRPWIELGRMGVLGRIHGDMKVLTFADAS